MNFSFGGNHPQNNPFYKRPQSFAQTTPQTLTSNQSPNNIVGNQTEPFPTNNQYYGRNTHNNTFKHFQEPYSQANISSFKSQKSQSNMRPDNYQYASERNLNTINPHDYIPLINEPSNYGNRYSQNGMFGTSNVSNPHSDWYVFGTNNGVYSNGNQGLNQPKNSQINNQALNSEYEN